MIMWTSIPFINQIIDALMFVMFVLLGGAITWEAFFWIYEKFFKGK